MNILKIKDPQGNWVDIPALKGDKGDKGDPGISPTIDSTLSQANQAADAKVVGDKIDEITLTIDETLTQSGQVADAKVIGDILNTKANQNGYYENLNVGVADQLASKNYIEDKEPYTFRPAGGGAKVGTREYDIIVGGSIVWNQLVLDETISVPVNTYVWSNIDNQNIIALQQNHIYLLMNDNVELSLRFRNTSISVITNSGQYIIYKPTISNSNYKIQGNGVTTKESHINYFDLTQMFGSEIADYIYNLEQTTPGAGVAWFRKYFPEDYYEYNAGELMHVSGVSAHKMYDADENVIATYPLDSSLTLRGVPKIADGKLYYDGDRYKANGTVERRYEIVDLGTLKWSYNIANQSAFTSYTIRTQIASNDIVCPIAYEHIYNFTSNELASKDKAFGINITAPGTSPTGNFLSGAIVIKDSSYTDAESFKTAMSGVYLVYELKTPATEQTEPYQSPQIIDPYGTEKYVTTSLIPVGHETKYPENLRAKIEGLPWDFANLIAPVEATYIATRNYTSGSLFIVDNILYKATANIANGGTITPNTNCITTTLAEIIAAL